MSNIINHQAYTDMLQNAMQEVQAGKLTVQQAQAMAALANSTIGFFRIQLELFKLEDKGKKAKIPKLKAAPLNETLINPLHLFPKKIQDAVRFIYDAHGHIVEKKSGAKSFTFEDDCIKRYAYFHTREQAQHCWDHYHPNHYKQFWEDLMAGKIKDL